MQDFALKQLWEGLTNVVLGGNRHHVLKADGTCGPVVGKNLKPGTLRAKLVPGVAKNAPVIVAGIHADSELVFVGQFVTNGNALDVTDSTSEFVPGTGSIRNAAKSTAGSKLLVMWVCQS